MRIIVSYSATCVHLTRMYFWKVLVGTRRLEGGRGRRLHATNPGSPRLRASKSLLALATRWTVPCAARPLPSRPFPDKPRQARRESLPLSSESYASLLEVITQVFCDVLDCSSWQVFSGPVISQPLLICHKPRAGQVGCLCIGQAWPTTACR